MRLIFDHDIPIRQNNKRRIGMIILIELGMEQCLGRCVGAEVVIGDIRIACIRAVAGDAGNGTDDQLIVINDGPGIGKKRTSRRWY